MSNFDTVASITENVQAALRKEGIHFSVRSYEGAKEVPASLLPFGEIFYSGERFEETLGGRPGYIEASFLVRVAFGGRDSEGSVRDAQRWAHRIREALTVNTLNAGALSLTKYVSAVKHGGVELDSSGGLARLSCRIGVRYREN